MFDYPFNSFCIHVIVPICERLSFFLSHTSFPTGQYVSGSETTPLPNQEINGCEIIVFFEIPAIANAAGK